MPYNFGIWAAPIPPSHQAPATQSGAATQSFRPPQPRQVPTTQSEAAT